MPFLNQQLFTASREGVFDDDKSLVHRQEQPDAIPFLEQKLSDAKKHLDDAKANLAKLTIKHNRLKSNIICNQKTIRKSEGHTIQLLKLNKEKDAEKFAEQIANLEYELSTDQKRFDDFDSTINRLNQHIPEAERQFYLMDHQITVLKIKSVEKAKLVAITNALDAACESLERINNEELQKSDRDFETGIKTSSYMMLERIKAKWAEKRRAEKRRAEKTE